MNTLVDLLPDEFSDDAAYHLVNFVMELSLTLESRYYKQMMRYAKENSIDPFPYNFLPQEDNF